MTSLQVNLNILLPLGDSAPLFRSKSEWKQYSTGYGTYERCKVTQLTIIYREFPLIIRPIGPQSILAPAQIIGQSPNAQDDEVSNGPTTGATVSPHFPHPRTGAVPPLHPQSAFRTSLLDVTTDSLPHGGFIGHISMLKTGSL
jgi:hypothetical protein